MPKKVYKCECDMCGNFLISLGKETLIRKVQSNGGLYTIKDDKVKSVCPFCKSRDSLNIVTDKFKQSTDKKKR